MDPAARILCQTHSKSLFMKLVSGPGYWDLDIGLTIILFCYHQHAMCSRVACCLHSVPALMIWSQSLLGQGVTLLTLSQAFGGYLEIFGAHPPSKAINLGTKQTFNLKLQYTQKLSDLYKYFMCTFVLMRNNIQDLPAPYFWHFQYGNVGYFAGMWRI